MRARESVFLTTFASLGLCPPILRAVAEEGYSSPTPIQAQAIGPALRGRDLLACAQTGTGKTAAFALPILQRLFAPSSSDPRRPTKGPRALVLAPTRELATQIGESFRTYGRHTGLRHAVIFGGVNQFHQVRALQSGVDVLVATPGRLLDLLEQRLVQLAGVEVLVLDEADRMLDMGFIRPIRQIEAQLRPPGRRQTLMFSATLAPPIIKLAASMLSDPLQLTVAPAQQKPLQIEQSVYMVPRARKPGLLRHLLADAAIKRAVVFTRTKHGAERLSRQLNQHGVVSDAIHGNKAQNQRQRALAAFRDGRARVLVATDVAARGLDVDGITHVFNFDLPIEPEAYVHRIGRTGRAGAAGVALSFCDGDEHQHLKAIERLIGKRLPAMRALPDFPQLDEIARARPPQRRSTPARPSPRGRGTRGRVMTAIR
ncbi:ATP-dependent RNA helicase RhlE [Phycisphaerae bacterium RAS1]|nr:ATP-dependent RNA helicase RhlE [Phycisphaerae bacterium RAS1]